jgi:glycosyltransferase involved in cell wall biosynthesis
LAREQEQMNSLQLITAVPLSVQRGSGCYIGTQTLTEGLRRLGLRVELITPNRITPVYTLTRVLFNEQLRWRRFNGCATVGIDADGYAVPRSRSSPPHIACIKGVLGDAVRFERGATRASMALQAWLEKQHARRADLVITVSRYCAERLEELYGVKNASIVPELIDLDAWRELFRTNPAPPDTNKFTVLSVCRFYPRKRLDVLLRAAALLRNTIRNLEVRIVGNGPEYHRLRCTCATLSLQSIVHWLGDVTLTTLAEEYNRADVFCLPSVQEGFGIVFLEAMAAGKPIVAARSAAVPEVVGDGILVEPDDPEALANGIARLYRDPHLRNSLGTAGVRNVEQFEIERVAARFVSEVAKVAPAVQGVSVCRLENG